MIKTSELNLDLLPYSSNKWNLYTPAELLENKEMFDMYMHNCPTEEKYKVSDYPILEEPYKKWYDEYLKIIRIEGPDDPLNNIYEIKDKIILNLSKAFDNIYYIDLNDPYLKWDNSLIYYFPI